MANRLFQFFCLSCAETNGQNQPSQLLLQQTQDVGAQQMQPVANNGTQRPPAMANTMVPESKFTQVLHKETVKAQKTMVEPVVSQTQVNP